MEKKFGHYNIMTFVVAKYKEDVSWTSLLEDNNIFIINKDPNRHGTYNMDLPNEGRESHSYLTYIVEHYDKLDDYTCFLQGNPLGHTSLQIVLDGIRMLEIADFISFGEIYKERKNEEWSLSVVNYAAFEDIVDIPEEITFKAGAQFVVSKQKIQKHPKEFYKKLLERHDTIVAAPWTIERLWHIIFS